MWFEVKVDHLFKGWWKHTLIKFPETDPGSGPRANQSAGSSGADLTKLPSLHWILLMPWMHYKIFPVVRNDEKIYQEHLTSDIYRFTTSNRLLLLCHLCLYWTGDGRDWWVINSVSSSIKMAMLQFQDVCVHNNRNQHTTLCCCGEHITRAVF